MSAITKETANSGHYGSKNKKKGAIKSEKKGVQELHTKVKRSEGFGSIMIESAIEYFEWGVAHAHVWVFALVFVLISIENSLIYFPSEVIMIPGGFSAYRGELTFGDPVMDVITVIVYGLADTMAGAFFNRIKTLSSIYSI